MRITSFPFPTELHSIEFPRERCGHRTTTGNKIYRTLRRHRWERVFTEATRPAGDINEFHFNSPGLPKWIARWAGTRVRYDRISMCRSSTVGWVTLVRRCKLVMSSMTLSTLQVQPTANSPPRCIVITVINKHNASSGFTRCTASYIVRAVTNPHMENDEHRFYRKDLADSIVHNDQHREILHSHWI